MSDAELKQLALVGINSIMQTSKELPVGDNNIECVKRYNNILDCCMDIDSGISAMISNVALSDYDEIRIVQDE